MNELSSALKHRRVIYAAHMGASRRNVELTQLAALVHSLRKLQKRLFFPHEIRQFQPEVESLMDCQLFKMRLMQQEPIVAVPPKPSSYDLLLSPRHPSTGCAHGLCMKKTSEFQLVLLFCPICEVATYFGLLRYASRATC